MGMDNKFVVLDKSREKLEALHKFIEDVKNSSENNDSEYRISTYGFEVRQYGEYWGLEGEFRNTVLSDLEYWLELRGQEDIVKDSLVVINYENSDFAVLYTFIKNDCGESLFDVYDGTLCEEGYEYEDILPMDLLKKYFLHIDM